MFKALHLWNNFLVATGLKTEQIVIDERWPDQDPAAQPADATDPDQVVLTYQMTKGEMDGIQADLALLPHLRNRVNELEMTIESLNGQLAQEKRDHTNTIEYWQRFWATKEATQKRVIRRLFRLPKTLAQLLGLDLGEATVLTDGVVRYPLRAGQDPLMYLDIAPFESKVTAVDEADRESALELTLSRDGGNDAYRELVLLLRGFGDTVKNGNGDTRSWVDEVNKVTALDAPSGVPTATNVAPAPAAS